MRKSLLIFIILLILSIIASFVSMMLVHRPYECPLDVGFCPEIYKLVSVGFPINMVGGPFEPNIMFAINTAFYFLIFSTIYFAYSKLFKKWKKK